MSERKKLVEKLVKRGLVLSLIVLFIAFIWLGVWLSEPSRVDMNHRRAVMSIANLNVAEKNYAAGHLNVGYACKLSDLGEQGMVDGVVASGTKAGYHFEIQCSALDGSQKITSYTIIAVPTVAGTTGKYAFCADQSGAIWYSGNGSVADCLSKHKPV